MTQGALIDEKLTGAIIGAFYSVYRALGFGFLEHVYIMALDRELRARGHHVAREVSVQIMYKGEELCRQRLDMVVDEKVVVETKSTYELHPAAQRQLYNYLRATKLDVGLLFHFGREPQLYRLFCRRTHDTTPSRPQSEPRHSVPGHLRQPDRIARTSSSSHGPPPHRLNGSDDPGRRDPSSLGMGRNEFPRFPSSDVRYRLTREISRRYVVVGSSELNGT